jgi:multidrug resistance efflux pump
MHTHDRRVTLVATALLFIPALVVSGSLWATSRGPDNRAVETVASVEPARLAIITQGQVVPVDQAMLAFPVAGIVAEVMVQPGQVVNPGQLLVRLDGREEAIGIDWAETVVLQAEADHRLALANLAAAQASLAAADAKVTSAQADLDLVAAEPTAEEVALQDALVSVAAAGVQGAVDSRAYVLEGANAGEIAEAEAALTSAQSELFIVRQAALPIAQDEAEDPAIREQAQMRINSAEAGVAAAQMYLDELRAGAAPAVQQAASSGVGAAAQELDAAKARRDLMLASAHPEAIAVAEALVQLAQKAVVEAGIEVEQAEAAVALAEAHLREVEATLEQAQAAFERTLLRAPFAGTVADIAVRAGESAQPEAPVLTLADMRAWRIKTIDLSELDVVRVRQNASVSVVFDAYPGQPLQGHVTNVAAASDHLRGAVAYMATIELDDPRLSLRWGMTAMVTIEAMDTVEGSVQP